MAFSTFWSTGHCDGSSWATASASGHTAAAPNERKIWTAASPIESLGRARRITRHLSRAAAHGVGRMPIFPIICTVRSPGGGVKTSRLSTRETIAGPAPVLGSPHALARRAALRATGAHGGGFPGRARGHGSRGAYLRLPAQQPPLQEPRHQGRLSALDPQTARANLPRVGAVAGARHQGRAHHP